VLSAAHLVAESPPGIAPRIRLAQVALGSPLEVRSNGVVNIGSLPKGLPADRISVKGCGSLAPDPAGFRTLPDGEAAWPSEIMGRGPAHSGRSSTELVAQ
jgi:hypothetical protein